MVSQLPRALMRPVHQQSQAVLMDLVVIIEPPVICHQQMSRGALSGSASASCTIRGPYSPRASCSQPLLWA